MSRARRIIQTALLTAGIIVLAEVAITLVWQEPLSALFTSVAQGKAQNELDQLEAEIGPTRNAREGAERLSRMERDGQAIGRISSKELGIDMAFFEGTSPATLEKGPGHYPRTALPGQGRVVAIAGHRTTYLAPFRDIDDLNVGDEILLEMPYGDFTYEVEGRRVVRPDQGEVIDEVGYERLVLSACHPLYSAAERYIVFARFKASSVPLE